MSERGTQAGAAGDAGSATEPAGRVRGVVFGHGRMAEGLVSAVRRISDADEDALVALTNEGLGPDELRARVGELTEGRPTLVFTDLHAGSCTMAAQLSCRGAGHRAVVCGVNLPMLLEFVFNRELPLDELVDRVVEKGRGAIRCITPARPTAE